MSLFVCQFGIKLQFKVHKAPLFSHFLGLHVCTCMYLLLMTEKDIYLLLMTEKNIHIDADKDRQTQAEAEKESEVGNYVEI